MQSVASDPSSSISEEQQLHDSLHSTFKQQAAVLLQQLLAFETLAARNEKAGFSRRTLTDGSLPSVDESSSFHSIGRLLMLHVDLWHRQVHLFEEIKAHRAARKRQIAHPNELCSLFTLVSNYGNVGYGAMWTASRIASGKDTSFQKLVTFFPKREPLTPAIEALNNRIREEKEPLQYTINSLKEWENLQDMDIPKLIAAHTWWKNQQNPAVVSRPSATASEFDDVDYDADAPSTSSPSSTTSALKSGYTLGPLDGKDCGCKVKCKIRNESVDLLFSRASSHSYISRGAVKKLKMGVSEGDTIRVKMTNGRALKVKEYVRKCPILLQARIFMVDLIVLPIAGCDVVLGNDWISCCEHYFETAESVTFLRGGLEMGLHDTLR